MSSRTQTSLPVSSLWGNSDTLVAPCTFLLWNGAVDNIWLMKTHSEVLKSHIFRTRNSLRYQLLHDTEEEGGDFSKVELLDESPKELWPLRLSPMACLEEMGLHGWPVIPPDFLHWSAFILLKLGGSCHPHVMQPPMTRAGVLRNGNYTLSWYNEKGTSLLQYSFQNSDIIWIPSWNKHRRNLGLETLFRIPCWDYSWKTSKVWDAVRDQSRLMKKTTKCKMVPGTRFWSRKGISSGKMGEIHINSGVQLIILYWCQFINSDKYVMVMQSVDNEKNWI